MFSSLKESIRQNINRESTDDLMMESVAMNDVKDLFIDRDNVDENDPALMNILDAIPEDEDTNIEELSESAILDL